MDLNGSVVSSLYEQVTGKGKGRRRAASRVVAIALTHGRQLTRLRLLLPLLRRPQPTVSRLQRSQALAVPWRRGRSAVVVATCAQAWRCSTHLVSARPRRPNTALQRRPSSTARRRPPRALHGPDAAPTTDAIHVLDHNGMGATGSTRRRLAEERHPALRFVADCPSRWIHAKAATIVADQGALCTSPSTSS